MNDDKHRTDVKFVCYTSSHISMDLKFFIYFWLHWVFIATHKLSLVAVSVVFSSLSCTGFPFQWLLLLQSVGFRYAGSADVEHWLSCSEACGIFPDQGLNLCPLYWLVDS